MLTFVAKGCQEDFTLTGALLQHYYIGLLQQYGIIQFSRLRSISTTPGDWIPLGGSREVPPACS